jgi:hypothetical protein
MPHEDFMHPQTLKRLTLWTLAVLSVVSNAAPVSPSEILRKTDEKLGSNYVSLPHSQQLAIAGEDGDKSHAPYFHVPDGSGEQLPLKQTSAQVDIAGVIARVKVKQVFENTGSHHRGHLCLPRLHPLGGARDADAHRRADH